MCAAEESDGCPTDAWNAHSRQNYECERPDFHENLHATHAEVNYVRREFQHEHFISFVTSLQDDSEDF
jgi:hypothetical protein